MNRSLNLTPVNYWTEQPFLDRMRTAGVWSSQGGSGQLLYDPFGRPANFPPGATAVFAVVQLDSPGETFELRWQGAATVQITGSAVIASLPGRLIFKWLDPAKNGQAQVIVRSGVAGTMRLCKQIEWPALDGGGIWRASFLVDMAGFTAFRTMDWTLTNGSTRTTMLLDDTPASYGLGVPLAVICDLARRTGARPWICLPHLITDAAITAVFAYLDAHCPTRPIIEFSNEVWNTMFAQAIYANGPTKDLNVGLRWYGQQCARVARQARGRRIDVVVMGQTVVAARLKTVLDAAAAVGAVRGDFKALGYATYIGSPLNDFTKYPTLAIGLAARHDIAGAHKAMIDFLPAIRTMYEAFKPIAATWSAEIWAYEGGNFHLNSYGAATAWIPTLIEFFRQVQLSPSAPYTLSAYDNMFASAGGTLQALFNLGSPSSISGFFGMKLCPLSWAWVKAEMMSAAASDTAPATPAAPTPPVSEAQGAQTVFGEIVEWLTGT